MCLLYFSIIEIIVNKNKLFIGRKIAQVSFERAGSYEVY